MADLAKWRAWKAENPWFPLSVGVNGQWKKKIDGKTYCFGVLDKPTEAAEIWNHEKPFLLVGKRPPRRGSKGMSVDTLCDKYLNTMQGKGLAATYLRDLTYAAEFMREHLVATMPVKDLTPEHFADLRQDVTESGRGLRGQKNLIASIRTILLWGMEGERGMGFYPPVQFGPEFRAPRQEALDREREASGRTRFIDREDILTLLEHAKPGLKCMILLGINCGFYAQDSIRIPHSRLHLDTPIPHHTFPRVKNGRRRAAVLWPETVKALQKYIRDHRGGDPSPYVILNQYGRPYTDRATGRGIRRAFDRLATKNGIILPAGASIGSLRHTYSTLCDHFGDQKIIDLTTGHTPQGMQKRVYSQLNLKEAKRLQKLAKIVRKWLYKGKLP